MGVGLAMDALAVSLALGTVGWSCPKSQPAPESAPNPSEKRPWYRRLPFLSPTPAAGLRRLPCTRFVRLRMQTESGR